jgi:hypothetical protein
MSDSGCLKNLPGDSRKQSGVLGVSGAKRRWLHSNLGGCIVRNLNVGHVVGWTFDLLGVEIPDTAHIPPPAEPTVARCVMPATLPPSQSTMIKVAAEILRPQRTVRQSCALLRSRSRAAPFGCLCALKTRAPLRDCAKQMPGRQPLSDSLACSCEVHLHSPEPAGVATLAPL